MEEIISQFTDIILNTYVVDKTGNNVDPISLKYNNGKYCQSELVEIIKETIVYFALTNNELCEYKAANYTFEELVATALLNISTRKKEIKGDYGELLLFLVISVIYSAPKLITKVRYRNPDSKTEVLGFDCIHFTVIDNDITMWLGEAKFHKYFENNFFSVGIDSAVDSLNNHLNKISLLSEMKWFKAKFIGEFSDSDKKEDWYKVLHNLFLLTPQNMAENVSVKVPILVTYDEDIIKFHNNHDSTFISAMTNELNKKINILNSKPIKNEISADLLFIFFPMESVSQIKDSLDCFEKETRI